jgi:radical SAM protein with 4Fe4S-binding SPASM domain
MYNYHKRKIVLDNAPTFFWIEPTNKCNLKCIVCPNSILPKDQTGYMEFELFKKIIDECKEYVCSAFLFLGGESLLHKDIFKMIRYAKDNGIRPLLHTNATLLNEANIEKIFESGLDYISFSMDGFTKEVYEKIRVNADFYKTLAGIVNFLKKKKELGARKPYTVIQTLLPNYVDYKPDTPEEKAFYKIFEGLPVDEMNIRIPHAWGDKLFKTDKYIPKKLGNVFSPCSFLWGSLSILYDGTVVPCCIDFSGQYALGNVKDKSILEIWNSEPLQHLRKSMVDGTYTEKNSICNNCMYIWEPRLIGLPVGLAMILGQAVMNIIGSDAEKYFKRAARALQHSIWYVIKK